MQESDSSYLKGHFEKLNSITSLYDRDFDSKLTYIGCGAIVLSFTFFSTKGLLGFETCSWKFIWGEVLLIASIILHLTSFLAFKCIIRRRLSKLKAPGTLENIQNLREEIAEWESRFRCHVMIMNWVILSSQLIGLLLLVTLAICILLP